MVSEANVKDYMSLMSKYRKTENAVQAEMLHAGLSQIIPTDLLSMFTASEFRAQVVGGSHISTKMLQVSPRVPVCLLRLHCMHVGRGEMS